VVWTPPQTSAARYHRGWIGESRSEIFRHLVLQLEGHQDLRSLAHGAAVTIQEIMAASSAHITLMEGDRFRDLVNVGELAPDQVTLPDDAYYPLSDYPAAAERLLSHRGYLSTDQLAVVAEYVRQSPRPVQPCFMGVPIVAQGRVLGEVFLARGPDVPVFTHEDLELAMDLATVVGSRIAGVVGSRCCPDQAPVPRPAPQGSP
jgi:GAF domain-containing protein